MLEAISQFYATTAQVLGRFVNPKRQAIAEDTRKMAVLAGFLGISLQWTLERPMFYVTQLISCVHDNTSVSGTAREIGKRNLPAAAHGHCPESLKDAALAIDLWVVSVKFGCEKASISFEPGFYRGTISVNWVKRDVTLFAGVGVKGGPISNKLGLFMTFDWESHRLTALGIEAEVKLKAHPYEDSFASAALIGERKWDVLPLIVGPRSQ
jgi:hypothetical protein